VRAGGPDHHQLLRLHHRQQAQHQLVDERENSGTGADSQRQRGDRHQGKERTATQVTQGKPEVEQESGFMAYT
jgi:hypothetical protein